MRVLFIAPYKGLAELVESLKLNLQGYQVTTYVANLEESKNFITSNKYSDNDFDIIISRGGTASKLRENTSLQVVEVEVSGYDILRLTTYLKNFNSKVGVVGFNNIISNFKSVSSLIDIDLHFKSITHEKEVTSVIKNLKKTGISAVVGDTVTIDKATEIGMEGILLTSGKESIYDAFRRAEVLFSETQKLKNEIDIFRGVFDYIESPIVLFDSNHITKYENSSYQRSIDKESNRKVMVQYKILNSINEDLLFDNNISLHLKDSIFQEDYKLKVNRFSDKYMQVMTFLEYNKNDTGPSKSQIKVWDIKKEEVKKFRFGNNLLVNNNYSSQLLKGKCLSLIGEYGTGKEVVVDNILNSINGLDYAVEIDFYNVNTKLFNDTLNYIKEISSDSLIIINNIKNLSSSQQKKFTNFFIKNEIYIIFIFENDMVIEDLKIEKNLRKLLSKEKFYFPNLSQNDELIISFIINYLKYLNEKHGKQIVGVKNNDFSKYKSYSWPGNFIELKNTIDKLYEESKDEFLLDISEFPYVEQDNLIKNNSNYVLVNLNNSLFEIEKDIIKKIYKQEEYNKTKTAKRLSINRSTLWRKLDN